MTVQPAEWFQDVEGDGGKRTCRPNDPRALALTHDLKDLSCVRHVVLSQALDVNPSRLFLVDL